MIAIILEVCIRNLRRHRQTREVWMEDSVTGINQQKAEIHYGEVTTMISELMTVHECLIPEQYPETEPMNCDWVSPSKRTRIVRYGSSAFLNRLLNQLPDATAAEYDVIYQGVKVFSWCEYLWPHLQSCDLRRQNDAIQLPAFCLNELMHFHEQHATSWIRRFHHTRLEKLRRHSSRVKIDKISIVTQLHRLQL